jgi:hypothetical protein
MFHGVYAAAQDEARVDVTPVWAACHAGQLPVVRYLVEQVARPCNHASPIEISVRLWKR